jgi:hypothetical protein
VGRYVSNWRLQSPSGVFFGHKVWADIMVVKELDAGKSADSENDKPAVQNREGDNAEEEEDSDTNESEWELGRSKVRRIAKVIRGRSHSDIDSDDDEALSEAEADTEERGEQDETTDQTRDEGDNVAPAAQEAQEVAEEKEEEAQHQPPQQQSPASSEDEEWEVVPAKEEWADELAALRALGLDDLDAIRRALKEAKGNVDLAAQRLLGD